MFCKQFWMSMILDISAYMSIQDNFLYDTVQEDNIDYPLGLTWIDNMLHGEDDDLYAVHLLFVLTCSKYVLDAML